MKNEAVISRVQKLLALAESSNEYEAAQAFERAQELILKHNLEHQDFSDQKKEFVTKKTGFVPAMPRTVYFLILSLVKEFCFVFPMRTQMCQGKRAIPGTIQTQIVGTAENVEMAILIHDKLIDCFVRSCRALAKSVGQTYLNKPQSEPFGKGLVAGFWAKLKKQRDSLQKEWGLVVVRDPELDEIGNGMGTADNRKSKSFKNDHLFNAGFQVGNQLQYQEEIGR